MHKNIRATELERQRRAKRKWRDKKEKKNVR